jgi:hypothetical protein
VTAAQAGGRGLARCQPVPPLPIALDPFGGKAGLNIGVNGWPMRSPADASPTSSRMPVHGSGPMWIAAPSSQWICTTYSLPVSTGAPEIKNYAAKLGH